jgi:hypothetical protein
MESSRLVERVQELTDLELAILLCLVADQSCIIQTDQDDMESLEQELQLVGRQCLYPTRNAETDGRLWLMSLAFPMPKLVVMGVRV